MRPLSSRSLVHRCNPSLLHSSSRASLSYIDKWFASIVKPSPFYENQSSTDHFARCYFYNADLQGRLFLEETLPKNVAMSIKDARFLNLFYSRIRRVTSKDEQFMLDRGIPVQDYPFVSPCGRELNFLRPAASTPIVFHSLLSKNIGDDGSSYLVFAGDLKEEFSPASLAISLRSGRLYHRIQSIVLNAPQRSPSASRALTSAPDEYGLIRSSVAVTLSDRMTRVSHDQPIHDHVHESAPLSGWAYRLNDGSSLSIPMISDSAPWIVPFDLDLDAP